MKTLCGAHGVSERKTDAVEDTDVARTASRIVAEVPPPWWTMGLTELLLGLLWLPSALRCAGETQQCTLTAGGPCTRCIHPFGSDTVFVRDASYRENVEFVKLLIYITDNRSRALL